jgi:hypothetical protein
MAWQRFLQFAILILLCALGSFSSTSGARAAESSCTPAQKLANDCPNVTGTVNGDGVDIRGSVDIPGSSNSNSDVRGRARGGNVATPPPPPPPLRDGYTVTAPITLADLVNFTPVAGVDHMEPNGWMVVGLDTNFFATVESGEHTGLLLNLPASVRFTAERYRWSYGDGTSATRSTRGASWAASGVQEFDRTATSHVYRTAGTFSIDLAIDFSAEYQYAGGPWIPISGTIAVATNRLVATAGDANTVLVGRDCAERPAGPGC